MVVIMVVFARLAVDLIHSNEKEEIALDAAFIAIASGFLVLALGNFFMFIYFNCFVLSAYKKLMATLDQTSLNDDGRLLDAQTMKEMQTTAIETYKSKYSCYTTWKLVVSAILVLAMGIFSFEFNKPFYISVPLLAFYTVLRGVEVFLSFELRSWTGAEQFRNYTPKTGTVQTASHTMA